MAAVWSHLWLPLLTLTALSASEYTDPHCGGKQVIVHLFEWKHTDVAQECERYLAGKGYCGVQVSPPNEYVTLPANDRPWWERYQPVSYKLASRSGTEQQFTDMVHRCKAVGVRVYVDVVVNHMAGLGRKGVGTGGSHYDSDKYDFPGVPYRTEHFNHRSKCPSGDGNVNNYGDPNNVRNCNLVGLTDLDQSQAYVQEKIAGYFNHLIDIGVAGFRVDAAKHMWPNDIKAIQGKTKDLPEGGRPFFYQEVIDRNDGAIKVGEYTASGYVTEFRYAQKLAWGSKDFGTLGGVVDYGWGMTPSDHAFVFVDNHDTQRGHAGGGDVVTYKQPKQYKFAVAFMLAHPYGFPRVMSSYAFSNTDAGPPHNADYSIKDVVINADSTCGNGWICEHRWPVIANMVAFRNAVAGTQMTNFRDKNDQVSFSRGNKGFFAMAKQGHMDETLQTGLPAGTYCELISECKQKVTVNGDGTAHIVINNQDNPVLAFITGPVPSFTLPTLCPTCTHPSTPSPGPSSSHMSTPSPGPATSPMSTPSEGPPPAGWARTVIFIQKQTQVGQDLFIRGGIDHSHRAGCIGQDASTSPCAIPIKQRPLGAGTHFAKYNAWSRHDTHLDWYGRESNQGSYNGHPAEGTPAVWTTNIAGKAGYNEMNKWGEHYWMIDIDMDCSKTDKSWFELKAVVNGQWEHNIGGIRSGCTGTSQKPPYAAMNHMAICGYLNVFHFDRGTCEIHVF